MVSILRRAIAVLLVVVVLGVTSCGGDRAVPVVLLPDNKSEQSANPLIGAIAEVSPPERIQQLKPYLDVYEPQVRIARPDPDETITSATVQVELQVRDFPIYKDQSLGFGPHLHLFVDDQPHQAIYDADAPITLENLAPGTHTLRLLAVRPWGESFKNEGAYDQVTFNVFAASPQNNPDDSRPVLTYNQPQDQYGAEPILLDFHLHNAPPHLVAQADETIMDWQIRCTINGESFIFDRWQPIYLKGFQPGQNWVRLELIDENGNLIDNAFNSNIRVIDYQPGGEDGLSKLVRGEIPLAQAKALIDPSYKPPAPTVEEPAEPEATTLTPPAEPEPETESAAETIPEAQPQPETEPEATPAEEATSTPETTEQPSLVPAPSADAETPPTATEAPAALEPDEPPQPQPETATPSTESLEPPADSGEVEPSEGDRPGTADEFVTPAAGSPTTTDTSEDAAVAPETDESKIAPTAAAEVEEDSVAAPEQVPVTREGAPATKAPKSSLDGVAADDLTEDSPLMESRDANFPEATTSVEPPVPPTADDTPGEADDSVGEVNGVDEAGAVDEADGEAKVEDSSPAKLPDTNLKTLEDNADLV